MLIYYSSICSRWKILSGLKVRSTLYLVDRAVQKTGKEFISLLHYLLPFVNEALDPKSMEWFQSGDHPMDSPFAQRNYKKRSCFGLKSEFFSV